MTATATEAREQLAESITTKAGEVASWMAQDWQGTSTLRRIQDLDELLEQAKRATVEQCRANGWTWIRIGEALGVSKQAAQKKYQV